MVDLHTELKFVLIFLVTDSTLLVQINVGTSKIAVGY